MSHTYQGQGFKSGHPTWLIPNVLSLYPFCIMLGMVAAIISIAYFWRKEKYQIELLLKLIIITIPSAIVGARLFYIFERLIANPANPFPGSSWYAVWEGGLSIQGGVIVPFIIDVLYLRSKKSIVDVRKAIGIILPAVLLGQAIGRWGNFANHEVYGMETSYESVSWLGDTIATNMYINGAYRQPLFLYESLTSIIGYVVIVWIVLDKNLLKPGSTGALYLLWYGLVRVAMEPLRVESYLYYTILAIISIIVGALLLAYFEITGRKIYNITRVYKTKFYVRKTSQFVVPTAVSTRWINE